MSTQHIADRINGFVSKDPKRVVDMWSAKKADRIHYVCLYHAGFFENLGTLTPKLVLDAGCGTGRLWHNLRDWGYPGNQIRGFDCSEEAIKQCPAAGSAKWVVADEVLEACRKFECWRYDFGTCFGPFAYTQGLSKWDSFRLLPKLREVCRHGVGYFMFTDIKDSKPGPVFARFHPDEVRAMFPGCEVIIDDEIVDEYYTGHGYEDYDKGIIKW